MRDEGRETLLYPLLARRLAEKLNVPATDLPPGEELHEVARRCLATAHEVHDLYRKLRSILRDTASIPVPEPLVRLAKIPRFKLYVTTTFDYLLERAINDEYFGGQRQTLVFSYAPNDRQDLPREFDRLDRPTIYHLMGRFSGTPHSYPVTKEDELAFLQSLQSKSEDGPNLLLDQLKQKNLLIIGSRFADWLASVFIHRAHGGRHLETAGFVADETESGDRSPVLFMQQFSGGSKIFRGRGAVAFIEELSRRWNALSASGKQARPDQAPAPPATMKPGAVFLSYAKTDREAAEAIRIALDRAGVDVIVDVDDAEIPERKAQKLRSFLGECSVFVPVVSKRSLACGRRFFHEDWVAAVREAADAHPSGRFILPVSLDDTPTSDPALPRAFGAPDGTRLPGGTPDSAFIQDVVRLQRSYRSASFA